jgi:hypothetical protein
MDYESTRRNGDSFVWRPHDAATRKAEIDLSGMGMAMIRADLAGLPTGDGDVPVGDPAENFFDVVLGIPLLLALETKNVHGDDAPAKLDYSLTQPRFGQERAALRTTCAH